jgi:hypothetical protein
MKRILTTIALLTLVQLCPAQEKLSRDEAQPYADAVSADTKQLSGTPIPTDVDTQQPVAIRDGEFGGLVLPQKNLKADDLAKSTNNVVPIGQIWFLKLAPMLDGQVAPTEKLRLAKVNADGEEFTVPQCALGVRRKNADALEMVIFGKSKEPLLSVPLKAINVKQDAPLDLAAERESESGKVTVKILGKYEGSFSVTEFVN